MVIKTNLISIAFLLTISHASLADKTNNPDPYANGFGFDKPDEAAWGAWTRGRENTIYAEWDTYNDASHGTSTDRTAAADLGSTGLSTAYLGWNPGTFKAGSGNLYGFSIAEKFTLDITAQNPTATPSNVALQIETWGEFLETSSLLLNNLAPTLVTKTYANPSYVSSFGEVALEHWLILWELPKGSISYHFDFGAMVSTSLAQVAVDIGPSNVINPPVANAGTDFSVHPSDVVELNGAASGDTDNDSIISYEWSQTAGTPVMLSNTRAAKPSFTAPSELGQLEFSLKVSVGKLQSNVDTVAVTVTQMPINHPPVVDAGSDVSVNETSQVTLVGMATDPEGDGLTYHWEQTSGKPVELVESRKANLVFNAPGLANGSEILEFQLTATETMASAFSTSDTVKVQVNNDRSLLDCSQATASKSVLWPANANLVTIKIAGITSPTITAKAQNYDLVIDKVTQDEPVKNFALKDKTSPDAKITKAKRTAKKPIGKDLLLLRAERQGLQPKKQAFNGNGRVYQVTFTAREDDQSCIGSVKVQAPSTRNVISIDDGQVINSTGK